VRGGGVELFVQQLSSNRSPAHFTPKANRETVFAEQPQLLCGDQDGAINRRSKTHVQPACAFVASLNFGFGESHVRP